MCRPKIAPQVLVVSNKLQTFHYAFVLTVTTEIAHKRKICSPAAPNVNRIQRLCVHISEWKNSFRTFCAQKVPPRSVSHKYHKYVMSAASDFFFSAPSFVFMFADKLHLYTSIKHIRQRRCFCEKTFTDFRRHCRFYSVADSVVFSDLNVLCSTR